MCRNELLKNVFNSCHLVRVDQERSRIDRSRDGSFELAKDGRSGRSSYDRSRDGRRRRSEESSHSESEKRSEEGSSAVLIFDG